MESVLISINPRWCELIASGKKTVEVRKTRPKMETPFKVYIYCTKGRGDCLWRWKGIWYDTQFPNERPNRLDGKVIGEFVCDRIDYWQYNWQPNIMHIQDMSELSCVSVDDLLKYSNNAKDTLYAWHISDLVIYDKPRELSEFYTICPQYDKDEPICEGCDYEHTVYCGVDCPPYFECKCEGRKPLKRPPQSWCYVEDL